MPITRKQISAAASTSNPPARNAAAVAIKSNLPVSDDDLFEQSAIQVSSASRQTRTINHQIPKEMRKQLHGAFKAAAASNNTENIENVGDGENRAQNRSAKGQQQAPLTVQARTLVKRSSTTKSITPAVKQPSISLAERKENVLIDNDVDDTIGDDAIFDVPVTSPPRLTITINLSSAKNSAKNSANKTVNTTAAANNTVSTPSKTVPPIKQQQPPQLATPSKLLNQVTSHQILAEVRKTPLTMAEKKRRQSIVVGKNAVLDKSTRTAISALKPTVSTINTVPAVDVQPTVVAEDKSIVNDDIANDENVNDDMFIDILGSDSQDEAPPVELVEEKENVKKKRKQFIRNQATESAPPDILSTVDKSVVVEIVDKTPEKAIAETSIVDAIIVDNIDTSAIPTSTIPAVDPVVDVSCMHVPPPPKLEDLETLDPELYVKLKCGSLKDDLSVPFISETDRVDIENFLESFTSPELTKNLLPVAIIGEGTFSTVYKVIDKNFYECDNSAWVEYSRQSPLDWLRLWRWVYAQEPKDRLVLIKDGRKCVDRNGRSIASVAYSTVNTTVSTVNTTDSTVTANTSATNISATVKPSKGRLPGLLRRYLLEWAMRSLDSLQGGQEISESLLTSITPRVLQAAMLRFRPFFTALKRINATSSPQRILDEISFLKHLGGKNNVVPLINGMRCEDQVLVTFPYFYSEDFREFLGMSSFNLNSIACYMRSLFISLAHLHAHGIIHRDIKPSNFLFAPENGGRAVLLDFGLAQKVSSSSGSSGVKSHGHHHHRNSIGNTGNNATLTQQQRINTNRNNEKERKKLQAVNMILNTMNASNASSPDGDPCAKLRVLTGQLGPGYFNNDPRAGMKASRAGTRGFRAPEVLFKCPNQTTALDIWSAGVILLTLLTRRYPFFQSSDDFDAIVEIANIFGNEEMAAAAKLYSRRWSCNVPSVPEKHITWPELCSKLNPVFAKEIPEECYDLLRECLHLNSEKRITAKSALKHPFILKYAK